jgi:hypothetical protein
MATAPKGGAAHVAGKRPLVGMDSYVILQGSFLYHPFLTIWALIPALSNMNRHHVPVQIGGSGKQVCACRARMTLSVIHIRRVGLFMAL